MTILDIMAPYLTDEVKQLAMERLLHGGNLAPRGCDRRIAKLAILVLLNVNPHEVLYQDEAAILYGLSADTVSKRQPVRSLERKANVGK